jgi:hypothetical protein
MAKNLQKILSKFSHQKMAKSGTMAKWQKLRKIVVHAKN